VLSLLLLELMNATWQIKYGGAARGADENRSENVTPPYRDYSTDKYIAILVPQ
jgi:hypothetical protein